MQPPLYEANEPALRRNALRDNEVIVYIWKSRVAGAPSGAGHAALAIPKENIYASLWPKSGSVRGVDGLFSSVPSELVADLATDCGETRKNRAPDYTYHFYHLKAKEIAQKFNEIKNFVNWRLISGHAIESCSSFVYALLKEGGIKQSAGNRSTESVSVESNIMVGSAGESSGRSAAHALGSIVAMPDSALASDHASGAAQASSYACEIALDPLITSPDSLKRLLDTYKAKEYRDHQDTHGLDEYTPPGCCCILL